MDSINPDNPYAAPRPHVAPVAPAAQVVSTTRAWRSGGLLVVTHGAALPTLCVKCNRPVERRIKRYNMAWYSPWAYLGLLLGLLPFVLIALATQKKMRLDVGVCDVHRRKRRNAILFAWLGALSPIALVFLAAQMDERLIGPAILLGMAIVLGSVLFGLYASRIIWPRRIDAHYAWVQGAGDEYLLALPEFPLDAVR